MLFNDCVIIIMSLSFVFCHTVGF